MKEPEEVFPKRKGKPLKVYSKIFLERLRWFFLSCLCYPWSNILPQFSSWSVFWEWESQDAKLTREWLKCGSADGIPGVAFFFFFWKKLFLYCIFAVLLECQDPPAHQQANKKRKYPLLQSPGLHKYLLLEKWPPGIPLIGNIHSLVLRASKDKTNHSESQRS